jgi:hypothetical protein
MYGYIETRFLNSDLKSCLDQLVHLQKKEKIKILIVKGVIKKAENAIFFQIRISAYKTIPGPDLTLN